MFVAAPEKACSAPSNRRVLVLAPRRARSLLILVTIAAACLGVLAGASSSSDAVAAAGEDLTRLLRAMALFKAVIAVAVVAGVWWRLGEVVRTSWLLAYLLACSAMAAGPGLIWSVAHVGAGALLTYGGILTAVLLLWRDEGTIARFAALVAERRAARRT